MQTDSELFDINDYYGSNEIVRPTYMEKDPLAIYQWHLYNVGQKVGSKTKPVKSWDLKVSTVYSQDITGRGVTIGIVDSGVDKTHPDLYPALDLDRSWNYGTKSNDPATQSNKNGCNHGTSVAGIAAGRWKNGVGIMGVAPEATIVGLNIGLGCEPEGVEITNVDLANSLAKSVDISSNSWGCGEDDPFCTDTTETEAIIAGAKNGRGGKGTIYLFAAGNEWGKKKIDANYEGRDIIEAISVGAMNHDGNISSYSNRGANVLVSAFGGEDPRIVTADTVGCNKGDNTKPENRMKHKLNSRGEYTHLMNGTSAATPMVAGVVALMLQVNPNLTYRDVRYILATTARNHDLPGDWIENKSDGKWRFSREYGFGLVDAGSAVEKAKNFTSLTTLEHNSTEQNCNDDLNNTTVTKTITLPANDVKKIEYTRLYLFITEDQSVLHFPGDCDKENPVDPEACKDPEFTLGIKLTSPKGTTSVLDEGKFSFPVETFNEYEEGGNTYGVLTFGSNAFLDEDSAGNWKVELVAKDTNRSITLEDILIEVKGHK